MKNYKILIIGLGSIGKNLAQSLTEKGYTINVWDKNKSRTKGGPKTSIDEELLYFANMLYATSKDDTKRVNSIVDGIHKLKPGITGLAQISGRDSLTIKEKVDFDLKYLNEKSLTLNTKIIFLTLLKVLRDEGIKH